MNTRKNCHFQLSIWDNLEHLKKTLELHHSWWLPVNCVVLTVVLTSSSFPSVTPYHLLYIAVKIMRLRIRDCLTVAFKHIGPNTNITREQIQSD